MLAQMLNTLKRWFSQAVGSGGNANPAVQLARAVGVRGSTAPFFLSISTTALISGTLIYVLLRLHTRAATALDTITSALNSSRPPDDSTSSLGNDGRSPS